jgi:hypothetical protein
VIKTEENNMAKRKLYSLNSLSTECGRNFRTLSRALSDTPPDGKVAGRPAWFMQTALGALDRHVATTGRIPSRPAPARFDPALERQILEIEASGKALDEFLVRLRAATVADRRRLVEAEGKVFGRHQRALAATVGTGTEAPLRRVYVDTMLGAVQAELLELCEWKLNEAAA